MKSCPFTVVIILAICHTIYKRETACPRYWYILRVKFPIAMHYLEVLIKISKWKKVTICIILTTLCTFWGNFTTAYHWGSSYRIVVNLQICVSPCWVLFWLKRSEWAIYNDLPSKDKLCQKKMCAPRRNAMILLISRITAETVNAFIICNLDGDGACRKGYVRSAFHSAKLQKGKSMMGHCAGGDSVFQVSGQTNVLAHCGR